MVSVAASGGSALTISFASTPAVGNYAMVLGSFWVSGGFTFSSVADNQGGGNTYTNDQASTTVGQRALLSSTKINTASGTFTVTVTTSASGVYYNLGLIEVSGLADAARDITASNNNIVTSGSTDASITMGGPTNQAQEFVLTAMTIGGSSTDVALTTPTVGYTNLYRQNNPFATIGFSADYKNVASIGTQSANWTHNNTSTDEAGAVMTTFKDQLLPSSPRQTIRRPERHLLSEHDDGFPSALDVRNWFRVPVPA